MKKSDINKFNIQLADKIRLNLIEIKEKRLTSRLSDLSGISRQAIIAIRNDTSSPRLETLKLLQKALIEIENDK